MQIEETLHRAEPDQSSPRADLEVARAAARQHGVLSVHELRACGLSMDAISVRAGNGRLHPMHRSIYAVGHANPTRDGCYLGAVKACGEGAVLCRHAAGAHVEIIEWEDRYPDVLVLGDRAPRHPRITATALTTCPGST